MRSIDLQYGHGEVVVQVPEENLLRVLEGNANGDKKTEEEIIIEALANPIESQRLAELVKPGERVCLVISDITRSWQKSSLYLPFIIKALNESGISDQDITFLCAVGSHRAQSAAEHRILLGEKLADRFTVTDHNCREVTGLAYVGDTSLGTPVWINKIALVADHLILTGAVVYHDLAGWGGGKKSILPGIAGFETIMANHRLSLSSVEGEGTHPKVKSGNIQDNPLHADMMEAAALVKPAFMFNVIMDEAGNIGAAVAGHYAQAHAIGQQLVSQTDGVFIDQLADLVIASAGGFPKDIDLYQASKAISNGREALKPGGTLVLLGECEEGFGDPEVQMMLTDFASNLDRERELRQDYTIAKYTGFLITEAAEKYRIILVSGLEPELLATAGIQVVKSVKEAMHIANQALGDEYLAYVIPKAANVLPILRMPGRKEELGDSNGQ